MHTAVRNAQFKTMNQGVVQAIPLNPAESRQYEGSRTFEPPR